MPSLCGFSKQDDVLVSWSDAVSANPLMDFETNEASFRVKLDQTLHAHITRVIEDPISSLEVAEPTKDTEPN